MTIDNVEKQFQSQEQQIQSQGNMIEQLEKQIQVKCFKESIFLFYIFGILTNESRSCICKINF